MTAANRIGHLQCGANSIEIFRVDFTIGVQVIWGIAMGPIPSYAGPVRVIGWDGVPFWGTEDNDDNFVSWPMISKGDRLVLPVVLGNPDDPKIQYMLNQARKEIEYYLSEPQQLEGM